MRRLLFALPFVLVLLSCSGSPFSLVTEDLTIHAHNQVLTLENRAGEPIYFHVVARPVDPRYDWWPCTVPEHCPSLATGERKHLSYGDIYADHGKVREAVVYWWFLEADEEGHRVARMDSQIIKLQRLLRRSQAG